MRVCVAACSSLLIQESFCASMHFCVYNNIQSRTDVSLLINYETEQFRESIHQRSRLVNRASYVWSGIWVSIKVDLLAVGAAAVLSSALFCYFIWKNDQEEMKRWHHYVRSYGSSVDVLHIWSRHFISSALSMSTPCKVLSQQKTQLPSKVGEVELHPIVLT